VPDHAVDTNVLLVASAAHPFSPFDDSDLPKSLQQAVFDWLSDFRADSSRQMVWDTTFRIYEEYRKKLTDQDYGLQVVHEKMSDARFVDISFDADGAATVPEIFSAFDRSDRKLLAVVLADRGRTTLVNATDTDWLEIEAALRAEGVTVDHLIEDWLRAKHAEKSKR
jgi:hypothetical protein